MGNRPNRPRLNSKVSTNPRATSHQGPGQQVEGTQAVLELIRANKRAVSQVLVDSRFEDRETKPRLAEIQSLCRARAIAIRYLSTEELDRVAKTSSCQGVLALADPIPLVDLKDILSSTSRPTDCGISGRDIHNSGPGGPAQPFVVVLDGVVDPQNFGAITRSSLAFGVDAVIIPKNRAASLSPSAIKAGAGAFEHVPIVEVPGIPNAIDRLKRDKFWVLGLDPAGPEDVESSKLLVEPLALVIGCEATGLSNLVRSRCDQLVRIPQGPRVDSLNASVACAVALYEVDRQRRAASG